jgi:hypothetical protein
MRAFVFAAALIGCATAPDLREGEAIPVLTPAQLEQAYDGRVACFDPDAGACGSVTYLISSTSRTRTTRNVSANDIQTYINDPLAQVVRSLAMFEGHRNLFVDLEVQRAAGNYRYVKEVSVDEAVLDRSTNRWCLRGEPGDLFENSTFYFSNNLSAEIANDERLTPETEARLRAFFRAVVMDEEFRTISLTRAQENSEAEGMERMLAMLDGTLDNCASYAGLVERGRIELSAMDTYVGGVAVPLMNQAVRSYPLDAVPPLSAD